MAPALGGLLPKQIFLLKHIYFVIHINSYIQIPVFLET